MCALEQRDLPEMQMETAWKDSLGMPKGLILYFIIPKCIYIIYILLDKYI